MLVLLKSRSSSRAVHHYHDDDDDGKLDAAGGGCGGGGDKSNKNHLQVIETAAALAPISLTVWRKSLVFSCSGFTVIGSDGSLAYRVDNYAGRPHHIVLMDGSGNPVFTLCRRKKLRLILDNHWLVYEGEVGNNSTDSTCDDDGKKPVFWVRKCSSMRMRTRQRESTSCSVLAHVYSVGNGMVSENKASHAYTIEGSYAERCCEILDGRRRAVAEIKKKEDVKGGVSFGLEVFHLIVMPGFESRFAMAVVLLLDQMFS